MLHGGAIRREEILCPKNWMESCPWVVSGFTFYRRALNQPLNYQDVRRIGNWCLNDWKETKRRQVESFRIDLPKTEPQLILAAAEIANWFTFSGHCFCSDTIFTFLTSSRRCRRRFFNNQIRQRETELLQSINILGQFLSLVELVGNMIVSSINCEY